MRENLNRTSLSQVRHFYLKCHYISRTEICSLSLFQYKDDIINRYTMHPTSLISVQFSYHFSGVTPAEAEMNYLNTAKMLDLYGVDIHTVMVSYRNTVFILLVQETIESRLPYNHIYK